VPLTEWDAYITPKWWLRYTNGAASIAELSGLPERDTHAMRKAAGRYDLPIDMAGVDTRILTIHASKGVEAADVVVYDGVTGSITDGMDESPPTGERSPDVVRRPHTRQRAVAYPPRRVQLYKTVPPGGSRTTGGLDGQREAVGMSDDTEAAREALEAAYVDHADTDPNKYELFAYADDLPAEIDDTEAVSLAASVLAAPPEVETTETAPETWEDAAFADVKPGVYPVEMVGYDGWMTHKGDKLPYAPWTDPDAPAPCSKHDTTADECDCSARYKWGWELNRRPFEKAHMALDDDRLDGLVFIQTEADLFVFVDGDDVRCPETGDVHPAFIALLEHFGLTYADVSTSGTGVHAIYRGDLPADETVATWQIDTEPWGLTTTPPLSRSTAVSTSTSQRATTSMKRLRTSLCGMLKPPTR